MVHDAIGDLNMMPHIRRKFVMVTLAMNSRTVLVALVLAVAGLRAEGMDYSAVFTAPPSNVPTPTMPDGPLLGNGDVGVVLAGPPEEQRFHIGKNDFWRRNAPSVITVGVVTLAIPELKGASYRQEQDLMLAEVRSGQPPRTMSPSGQGRLSMPARICC